MSNVHTINDARKRLEEIKKQHKGAFFIAVPKEEGFKLDAEDQVCDIVFLKFPDRNVMRLITPMLASAKLFDVAEVVLENCWIEGDQALKQDTSFVFGCVQPIEQVIGGRMGRLGK